MKLADIQSAIFPAAFALLPPKCDSVQARQMLLAIGLQESKFLYRRQLGNGPAASFWQFEKGGGVKGVMTHPTSSAIARDVCAARGVLFDQTAVWLAMQTDDVLGCCFARLLLLTDPAPLPSVIDAAGGWRYYERNWRPGKPHRETWDAYWSAARTALGA